MGTVTKRATPDYFVFDVETGGFSHKKNPVCEIAAILMNGESLEEIIRYETIIKPYNDKLEYTQGAENKHRLTIETLGEHGEEIETVIQEIKEILEFANENKKQSGKVVLVGHNVKFDIRFLTSMFVHCKDDLTKYVDTFLDENENKKPNSIDTIKLSHMAWGKGNMSFKLRDCCEKAEIVLTNAHSAMNDVEATTELLRKHIIALRNSTGNEGEYRDRLKFSFG